MHRRQALTAIAAGWGVLAGTAQAQNFPSRPLRLIVGYTAGGAVDIGEMLPATTEQPAAMLSSEKNRYEKLIREARIQPDRSSRRRAHRAYPAYQ